MMMFNLEMEMSWCFFRTFVKRDHVPLSAPNNNDTHADVSEAVRRDRSKVGDISL